MNARKQIEEAIDRLTEAIDPAAAARYFARFNPRGMKYIVVGTHGGQPYDDDPIHVQQFDDWYAALADFNSFIRSEAHDFGWAALYDWAAGTVVREVYE